MAATSCSQQLQEAAPGGDRGPNDSYAKSWPALDDPLLSSSGSNWLP
jgi:hypothetical protein